MDVLVTVNLDGRDEADHDGYAVDPDHTLMAWLAVPEYWVVS